MIVVSKNNTGLNITMVNVKSYNGYIVNLERMKSSASGNPRYTAEFLTDEGHTIHFCTAPDSFEGYEIVNYNKPDIHCCVEIGMYYGRLTLQSIISYN